MAFIGISAANRTKLIKLFQAVANDDLAALYTSLRTADASLRQDFVLYLSQNNIVGKDVALKYLCQVDEPMAAVRAAAVGLMLINQNKDS